MGMFDQIQNFLPFALIAAVLFMVLWFGRRRPRAKSNAQSAPTERPIKERQRLTKAIRELEINLMEFGRDIEARLDTRIHTLQELLRQADEKIRKLEELSGGKARRADEVPPLHREVYQLADDGFDKVEIARRTSTTPGEVELILGLRRTRGQ